MRKVAWERGDLFHRIFDDSKSESENYDYLILSFWVQVEVMLMCTRLGVVV